MKSRLIGCQNESIIMIDLIKNFNAINPFAVENDSASQTEQSTDIITNGLGSLCRTEVSFVAAT